MTSASWQRPLSTRSQAAIAFFLACSALPVWLLPERAAPLFLFVLITTTAWPWRAAWRRSEGTALRPGLIWVAVSIALALLAQALAMLEPFNAGRPLAARSNYLAVLAVLAALVFVLNARMPGDKVWTGLTVLLVVVFLIPFLEEPGRLRRAHGLARLQLDTPWALFYGFIAVVGVTNYLPTRFGGAAAVLGLALVVEYLTLTRADWPLDRRARLGTAVAWLLAFCGWLAHWCAGRRPSGRGECERLWFWFRDHWGAVWALRVLERFNREAALASWPVRLTWFGLEAVEPSSHVESALPVPDAAAIMLRGLLRRFAVLERLDRAARTGL
jgi:hypothetical protein